MEMLPMLPATWRAATLSDIIKKMSVARPFPPVKLIAGLIYSRDDARETADSALGRLLGEIDARSPVFDFGLTDYYAAEMGPMLKRIFLSFRELRSPAELAGIKLRTNALEEEIKRMLGAEGRQVNIDPGYLTRAALIMATAKDFSHRVPLRDGIYAHLELLFARGSVRTLEWTYPDFRRPEYHEFLLRAREELIRRSG